MFSNGVSLATLLCSPPVIVCCQPRNSNSSPSRKPRRRQGTPMSINFDYTHVNTPRRHLQIQTSASTPGCSGRAIRPAARLVGNGIDHEHIHDYWISSRNQLVLQILLMAPNRLRNTDVEQRSLLVPYLRHSRAMQSCPRHVHSVDRAAD